jgi:membrane protease YdiL (CAAX protease family)
VTSQRILLVDVPQYGFWKLLVLHLAPGALSTLVYLALTPLAARLHLPMLSALLIASVVALVPLEIGHLLLQGKRLNGRWSLEGIVLFRRDWRRWRYLLLPLGLFILSVAGFALSSPLDRFWQQEAFSWLPSWFVFSDLRQYAQFSRSALIIVFSGRLLLDGFLFPVVEEMYFRGYLLPRMSRFGWAAPFLNCALFAVYHFWQPYNWPTIFFISLPIVIGVWRTKNLPVGIYTHILLNLVGGISTLIAVLHPA